MGEGSGETCVVELSGLAARSLREPQERAKFRQQRVEFPRLKLIEHKPRFVVMYGIGSKPYFEQIAECALIREGVVKSKAGMILFTEGATAFGKRRTDWQQLGLKLQRAT